MGPGLHLGSRQTIKALWQTLTKTLKMDHHLSPSEVCVPVVGYQIGGGRRDGKNTALVFIRVVVRLRSKGSKSRNGRRLMWIVVGVEKIPADLFGHLRNSGLFPPLDPVIPSQPSPFLWHLSTSLQCPPRDHFLHRTLLRPPSCLPGLCPWYLSCPLFFI